MPQPNKRDLVRHRRPISSLLYKLIIYEIGLAFLFAIYYNEFIFTNKQDTNMQFEEFLTLFLHHINSFQAPIVEGIDRFTTQRGKKNIRIIGDGSVFCFIRIEDGAVLKAASWKAPAKHARGTIFTTDSTQYGVGKYGANYLR